MLEDTTTSGAHETRCELGVRQRCRTRPPARHDPPAHVHRRRFQTPSPMVARPGQANTLVKGDSGRPANTLGKRRALEIPIQPTRATRHSTLRQKKTTPINILVTYSHFKAVKPSKIPAGNVVRSLKDRDLPGSRANQRAENTRRAVRWASDSAAGHGHRQGMTGPLMCTDNICNRRRRWLQDQDMQAHL